MTILRLEGEHRDVVTEGEAVSREADVPRGIPLARRRSGLRENEMKAILVLGDAVALAFAAVLARLVWDAVDPAFNPREGLLAWQAASIPLWLILIWLLGGFEIAAPHFGRRSMTAVAQAMIGAAAVAFAAFYLFPFFTSRGATLVGLPVAALTILAWRWGYLRMLRSRAFDRRVAIVGTDIVAMHAATVMMRAGGMPYRLVAFLSDRPDVPAPVPGIPVIAAQAEDVWAQVEALGVDQLVIGDVHGLAPLVTAELVRCFEHGIEAQPATAVYEDLTGRVLASALEPDWYGHLPTHARQLYMPLKRAIDVVLSLLLSVVALPLVVLAMVAIALESGRPVLLHQVRAGQRGRPFVLYKLRSMRRDAEPPGEARWASDRDDRVSRVGRILRRTHVDELPQLWNVIKGDMSLIGPRPERPEFVERLSAELPLYRARLLLRPGITGWAQLHHGYAGSVQSNLIKLEYDLYYLRRIGLALDFGIALRTIGLVAQLRGR